MIEEDISDIVEVLRECAEDSRKVEGDYYADQFATDASVFDDAAHAIEKLRDEIIRLNNEATVIVTQTQRVMRLTDAERAAVASCIADDEAATAYTRAATLRGLLERLGDTPDTHATPSEGSVQSECTLTAEERAAAEEAIRRLWGFDIAATLRGLLERTGGGA